MNEISVSDYFTVKISNGITHIKVKPEVMVELEMVQEVIEKQREIQKGITYLYC